MNRPPETYTEAEVESLQKACGRPQYPTNARARALLGLLYGTGLRISEALDLTPGDVDVEQRAVYVRRGKGGKHRHVGLPARHLPALDVWLKARQKLGLNGVHPLFCTLAGRRMDASYIRQLLPRLGRKAGMAKRVHAHAFRHSLAADMASEMVPLTVIKRALGHSNIAITDRYIDHVRPDHVIEAMAAR